MPLEALHPDAATTHIDVIGRVGLPIGNKRNQQPPHASAPSRPWKNKLNTTDCASIDWTWTAFHTKHRAPPNTTNTTGSHERTQRILPNETHENKMTRHSCVGCVSGSLPHQFIHCTEVKAREYDRWSRGRPGRHINTFNPRQNRTSHAGTIGDKGFCSCMRTEGIPRGRYHEKKMKSLPHSMAASGGKPQGLTDGKGLELLTTRLLALAFTLPLPSAHV